VSDALQELDAAYNHYKSQITDDNELNKLYEDYEREKRELAANASGTQWKT